MEILVEHYKMMNNSLRRYHEEIQRNETESSDLEFKKIYDLIT